MIKLYTPYVDKYRGYEWSRSVRFEKVNTISRSIQGFFFISHRFPSISLGWMSEDYLGIRCENRYCKITRDFKPHAPINSMMLEICDKFLN